MQSPGAAAHTHSHVEGSGGQARAARKDVVIFTADDEFLLSLGPAMDDRHRSRTTDGTGAWTDTVRGRAGVALVDAATLANAPEIVRTMEAEFPALALVVVAPAAARAQWSLALTRGSIARLLDRESLTTEAIAEVLTVEPRARAAQATAGASAADGSPPGRARGLLIPGAILAAVALAGVLWFAFAGKDGAPPPPAGPAASEDGAATTAPPPPVATAPATETLSVPELLSAARVAFGERRYVEPAGNSALDLYARALAADADNAEADNGVQRVVAIAVAQLQATIRSGQFDDATSLLERLHAVAPDDPALATAAQELAAARPKWLTTRAREAIAADQLQTAERLIGELAALGADKATLQELRRGVDARRRDSDLSRALADARASLTGASLLDGSASGPRARLTALQQIDRRNAQVVAFQRDYQAALTRGGREAIRAGNFDGAEKLLAAAAELGNSRDVADARKELQTARDASAEREQQQRAEAARQRAERSTQTAAAPLPPPKMPKAKRRSAPKYPPAAERDGIEGAVVVEFSLTPEGRTRDIAVIESTPPGVFDEAAVEAVSSWRFEPISAADAARLPRSSVRLAFRIGDQ